MQRQASEEGREASEERQELLLDLSRKSRLWLASTEKREEKGGGGGQLQGKEGCLFITAVAAPILAPEDMDPVAHCLEA
jgi:hypothetical protein